MKLSVYWNKLARFLGIKSDQNDPQSSTSPETENEPYHKTKPGWLKLQFSNAADIPALNRLFDPDIKGDIDPDDNVFKREETYFNDAVTNGHAAFLADNDGNAYSLAIGYPTSLDGDTQKTPPDFIETGTAMAAIPGFQTALLLGSVITLKEWWESEPAISFAAAIKEKNIASVKTFVKMGWEKTSDEALIQQINDSCNQNLDPAYSDPSAAADEDWYVLRADAIQTKARLVLEFMERGTLHNKHTGEDIQLDLTALDDIGLTPGRLKAIAYAGITDKNHLKNMADYRQDQQPRQLMP